MRHDFEIQWSAMKPLLTRTYQILNSEKFFWFVIGLFIFQAVWIVFSALYPMAFDEAYHFNLTRVYAEGWLPLLTERPEGLGFNAVTRYPSYLFHYLMSFPYRAVAFFTVSEFAQVVWLRLINVAFFTGSLIIFRKIFIRAGLSRALAHIGILLFSLIPIVPLLAAHINYDNLLILLVAWMLLLAQTIIRKLQHQEIALKQLLIITIVGLTSTVVKYAVLPILLVIFGFIFIYGIYRLKALPKNDLSAQIKAGWDKFSFGAKVTLPLFLVLTSGLFIERYGVNIVQYGSLVPACDQVLSEEQCMEFGPYERNQAYQARRDPNFQPDRIMHARTWFSGMWYRTFFMINGDVPVDRYQNFPPLPLPAIAATATLVLGLLASGYYWRHVFWRRPYIVLLGLVSVFYSAILFFNNYSGYVELGRTAALNGRYLLLIFPAVIVVIGLGYQRLLRNRMNLKIIASLLAVLLFLQGGGLSSFLVRSSTSWYWPHPQVYEINLKSRDALKPLIFGSDQDYLRSTPR